MRNLVALFIAIVFFTACSNKASQQACDCNEMNKKIYEANLKAYNAYFEEVQLCKEIKNCADEKKIQMVAAFRNDCAGPLLVQLGDRQSDLLLSVKETTSRVVADTLTTIKSVCDVSVTTDFILTGFGKRIERDLDYYESKIKNQQLMQEYTGNLDIALKEHWRKKYNAQMTLGEVLILLKELKIQIYENDIMLEKNLLKSCR